MNLSALCNPYWRTKSARSVNIYDIMLPPYQCSYSNVTQLLLLTVATTTHFIDSSFLSRLLKMQTGGFPEETKKDFWEVKIVLENISFS